MRRPASKEASTSARHAGEARGAHAAAACTPGDVPRRAGAGGGHVRRATQQMGVCDAAQDKQVAIALHEAIQNITNDNDSNVEQGEQS